MTLDFRGVTFFKVNDPIINGKPNTNKNIPAVANGPYGFPEERDQIRAGETNLTQKSRRRPRRRAHGSK